MDDVSEWEQIGKGDGSKESFWLRSPKTHRRGLLKIPHEFTEAGYIRGEALSEALAAEVGKLLGLLVPEVELAQYKGRICPLVWDFRPAGYALHEGADLSASLPDQRRLDMTTVNQLLATHLGDQQASRAVVEMIGFDILIGNRDRHQRNWGLLVPETPGGASHRAPLYDNAAAFGSSIAPAQLEEHRADNFERFDRGFKYEITLSQSRPRIPALLDELERRWPESWKEFVGRLDTLGDGAITSMIDKMRPAALTEERAVFAAKLLSHRRDLIRRRTK